MNLAEAFEWAKRNCTDEAVSRMRSRRVVMTLVAETDRLTDEVKSLNHELEMAKRMCKQLMEEVARREEAQKRLRSVVQNMDALIQHQYTGSRDAMSTLQDVALAASGALMEPWEVEDAGR